MAPPLMVTTETATGSAHLPKNADTMYRDYQEDFWFIPTAEVPLTNMYRARDSRGDKLPIYLTAYTPCFRREKMSAGRDVRGIKRGHQFDKVEMVKMVRPETSDDELKTLVENACRDLPAARDSVRVIQMCTARLGFASAGTYDIEMWAPGVERMARSQLVLELHGLPDAPREDPFPSEKRRQAGVCAYAQWLGPWACRAR